MRKIKLMALLLATLMIVSAFAGCAGVKKEELDALDVRVQALEDLLNGQQKDLADIKATLEAGTDYSEILGAIDDIKNELEGKIEDVDDRVQDAGKEPTSGISDEVKAAQQKALALIEVREAEFRKVADEYSADDYTKINEALGTAMGAVNAATTTAAVDAAMAALNAELGKYMTYAMKAYDYYTQLLGGVNADAADLVAEARAFLKEVKAVFEGKVEFTGTIDMGEPMKEVKIDAYREELLYLVEEGSSESKDDYIDMYNAINTLCDLYVSTSTNKADTDRVYIIDAKGKIDYVDLCSLAAFTRWAKSLVTDIDEAVGEELIFLSEGYYEIDDIYAEYEMYVELAGYLGGDKLVALITNAAKIVEAEEQFKNLEEAVENYAKATKLGGMDKADVFYYYKRLVAAGAEEKLEANLPKDPAFASTKDRKNVWIADEYEKVEEILADWVAEYELSEKNMLAIIKYKEGANFYQGATAKYKGTSYKSDLLTNDLLVTAYNDFKTEIAEKIQEINGIANVGVPMVLAFDEVEDLFEDFLVLQEGDEKANHPANLDIKIAYNAVGNANMAVILRDSGIFTDLVEDRVNEALENGLKGLVDTHLIDLYTFESDVYQLESDKDYFNIYYDYKTVDAPAPLDNRAYGEVFHFFAVQYPHLRNSAKQINDKIEALSDAVEAFGLSNNEDFVILEGEYKKLTGTETYKSVTTDEVFTSADNVYVLVDKLYTKDAEMEAYMNTLINKDTLLISPKLTIKAFVYEYPEFEDLLDLDIFEAAKTTMDNRMVDLFAQADQLVEEVDAIGYVRLTNGEVFVDGNHDGKYTEGLVAEVLTVDHNGNGKYDPADELTTDHNGNGRYDAAEPLTTDHNSNGEYDAAEPTFTRGEEFVDVNGNGKWDSGEVYDDLNGNGAYDEGEPFSDRVVEGYTNGVYDGPEPWTDEIVNGYYDFDGVYDYIDANNNGVQDINGDVFDDLNGDGIWDAEDDVYVDVDGDGAWTPADEFIDANGNGVWDDVDTFVDTNGNGKFDAGNVTVIYYDANDNGKYDDGEEYKDGVLVDQTVPYLVSLEDKGDVDTAFATYTAWSKAGGALDQKIFTNYADEEDIVLEDVWYMEGLDNATEVKYAVDMIHELRYQVISLETMVSNFVKTVANVKTIDAANAFTVNLTDNVLVTVSATNNKQRYFAWSKYVASTHEDAKDNDGSYTRIVKDTTEPWKFETFSTNYDGYADSANGDLYDNIMSKQDLLKAVVGLYDRFHGVHVEYIPDADNNYSDGHTLYYQRTKYVANTDFDKAVEDYTKYDVLSVKGYLFDLSYAGVDAAVVDAFKTLINSATDLKTIENHIYTYNVYDKFNGALTITAGDLDVYAIYDFDRLS